MRPEREAHDELSVERRVADDLSVVDVEGVGVRRPDEAVTGNGDVGCKQVHEVAGDGRDRRAGAEVLGPPRRDDHLAPARTGCPVRIRGALDDAADLSRRRVDGGPRVGRDGVRPERRPLRAGPRDDAAQQRSRRVLARRHDGLAQDGFVRCQADFEWFCGRDPHPRRLVADVADGEVGRERDERQREASVRVGGGPADDGAARPEQRDARPDECLARRGVRDGPLDSRLRVNC